MSLLGALLPFADPGWGWSHHSWWGGGLMMFLWMLIVVGLILILARAFDRRPSSGPTSDAEQVLAARFARGEVDETEYRARLAVLKERR